MIVLFFPQDNSCHTHFDITIKAKKQHTFNLSDIVYCLSKGSLNSRVTGRNQKSTIESRFMGTSLIRKPHFMDSTL